MQNNLKKQRGFSLIEVLISMIVIAIGILGLGGLQITSIKGTNNAHARTVASMLMVGLSDRMRVNQDGVDSGYYDNDVDCASGETQCRVNTYCSAEEKARFDIQDVMCGIKRNNGSYREGGVANLLIGGSLQVSCTGGCNIVNATHDITISWNDSNVHKNQNNNTQVQSMTISIVP